MLTFKRIVGEDGDTRYEVYRSKELIKRFRPSNEFSIGRKKFSKLMASEAINLINYIIFASDVDKGTWKELTELEEDQIFEFYYKGTKEVILDEISKTEKRLKELKRKLNGL